MKGFRKLLSCILILSIVIGHLPLAAFAQDEPAAEAAGVDTTITGEKPEIEEIFQVVKLESDDSDVRYSANPDYCDDGITYAGSPATRSSGSETIQKKFQ